MNSITILSHKIAAKKVDDFDETTANFKQIEILIHLTLVIVEIYLFMIDSKG